MRLTLLLFFAIIFLNQSLADLNNDWEIFKQKYKKSYGTAEDDKHKKIFANTLKLIEEHNRKYEAGIKSFEMGINQFADMTAEEFNTYATTGQPSDELWNSLPLNNISKSSVPDQVNWYEYGFKNPVIQQGVCGSCYAMAATAAIEGHYFIKKKELIQLSQQEIVDCSRDFGNKGCQYGNMGSTINYLVKNGVGDASKNPYKATEEQCKKEKPRYYIKQWHRTVQDDEEDLKAAVALGPVIVIIYAGLDSFKYYNGGLYYDVNCRLSVLGVNHFVTVIGYGNDGKDYWLIKNSWGSNWGKDGYMKMARNRNNQCGIAYQALYPEGVTNKSNCKWIISPVAVLILSIFSKWFIHFLH